MTRSAREAMSAVLSDVALYNADWYADRILARLSEQGFVVVPREPTEEMIKAAWDEAWDDEDGYPGSAWAGPRTTYCAMLAAIDGKEGKNEAD